MFLKNINIRNKLLIILGIIVFLSAVQSVYIVWNLRQFVERADSVVLEQQFGIVLASVEQMNIRFIAITEAYLDAGSSVTRGYYNTLKSSYDGLIFGTEWGVYTKPQQERFLRLKDVREQMFALELRAIHHKEDGNNEDARAVVTSEEYIDAKVLFESLLVQEIAMAETQASFFAGERDNILYNVQMFALIGLGIIVVVGGLLIYIVSTSIGRTAEEIESVASAIAKGKMGGRVVVHSNDEIGRIAVAFNKCVVALDDQSATRLKEITKNIGQ